MKTEFDRELRPFTTPAQAQAIIDDINNNPIGDFYVELHWRDNRPPFIRVSTNLDEEMASDYVENAMDKHGPPPAPSADIPSLNL